MFFDLAAANHAQPPLPTSFGVHAQQLNGYTAQVVEKAADAITSGAYEEFKESREVLKSPSSSFVDKAVAGLVMIFSFGLMVGTVRATFGD
jgi:hypothetical protein